MTPILSKQQMSEEDIKLQYITPAITAKWAREKITMETKITDGRINLSGNIVRREKPKFADYVLWLNPQTPLAIVEAKDNNRSVSHGLQQAIEYALKMDVPFAYSSNGDGFSEHDFLTGKERNFGLDEFPSPEELIARYRQGKNGGNALTPQQEIVSAQPYYTSQTTHLPRTMSSKSAPARERKAARSCFPAHFRNASRTGIHALRNFFRQPRKIVPVKFR